jgi:hypothetical protein
MPIASCVLCSRNYLKQQVISLVDRTRIQLHSRGLTSTLTQETGILFLLKKRRLLVILPEGTGVLFSLEEGKFNSSWSDRRSLILPEGTWVLFSLEEGRFNSSWRDRSSIMTQNIAVGYLTRRSELCSNSKDLIPILTKGFGLNNLNENTQVTSSYGGSKFYFYWSNLNYNPTQKIEAPVAASLSQNFCSTKQATSGYTGPARLLQIHLYSSRNEPLQVYSTPRELFN